MKTKKISIDPPALFIQLPGTDQDLTDLPTNQLRNDLINQRRHDQQRHIQKLLDDSPLGQKILELTRVNEPHPPGANGQVDAALIAAVMARTMATYQGEVTTDEAEVGVVAERGANGTKTGSVNTAVGVGTAAGHVAPILTKIEAEANHVTATAAKVKSAATEGNVPKRRKGAAALAVGHWKERPKHVVLQVVVTTVKASLCPKKKVEHETSSAHWPLMRKKQQRRQYHCHRR